jgi:N-acetylglutamate synthase-like GNAT family acetyltransferase
VKIRRAEARDAPELTRVARAAKASWGYPEAWLREWQPQLTISEPYVRRHTVLAAEDDGRIVAMAALEDGPEGMELAHLWVLPDVQGRGVGRALFTCVADLARERGGHELRIESDPYAEPFYERLGAVRVGETPAPVAGVERCLPVLRFLL